MEKECAVVFDHVSKIYKLKKKGKNAGKPVYFYALKDISFQIPKGEVVGVLGTNGSGKSTLSSILAGISSIDSGTIKISGEQALIAINSGLNNQLTGLENIKLKGALLGLSKKRIKEIIDGVIDFAELGDFIDQPVKKYSSGMKSRLGFAISINLNPDIIIIDEALSVGDKGFAEKCMKRMNAFKEEGKTIFFISHSLSQVRRFCNMGLWIEGGQMMEYDEINAVCNHYDAYVEADRQRSEEEKKAFRKKKFQKRVVKNVKVSLIERVLLKVKGGK